MAKQKLFRLRDQGTMFHDASFTISGKEEKPLPPNPSAALRMAVRGGKLIEVQAPAEKKPVEKKPAKTEPAEKKPVEEKPAETEPAEPDKP